MWTGALACSKQMHEQKTLLLHGGRPQQKVGCGLHPGFAWRLSRMNHIPLLLLTDSSSCSIAPQRCVRPPFIAHFKENTFPSSPYSLLHSYQPHTHCAKDVTSCKTYTFYLLPQGPLLLTTIKNHTWIEAT